MPDKSLEQQMQEMLSGLDIKPDEKVWEVIRTEIREDKKRRFVFWWWLLPALLVGAIGIGFYLHNASVTNKHIQAANQSITTIKEKTNTAVAGKIAETKQQPDTKTIPQENKQQPTIADHNDRRDAYTSSAQVHKNNQSGVLLEKQEQFVENKIVSKTESPANKTTPLNSSNNNQQNTVENPVASNIEALKKLPPVQEAVVEKKEEVTTTAPVKKEVVKEGKDSADNTAPVVKPSKNKKWKFSAVTDVSLAQLSKALVTLPGADKSARDYYQSNPSSGVGTGTGNQNYTTTYTQQTPFKGYSLSFGVQAEKPIDDRFSFITGIQYQYVHYSSRSFTSRDSFVYVSANSSFANAGRVAASGSEISYSIHYLSVPLLFQYKIVEPLYVYAGLQNAFAISAKRDEQRVDYATQFNLANSTPVKNTVCTYQPSFTLGANVALYDGKKYTWFVAPHVDYGITKTFRESMEKNHALRYGVQLSIRKK